jgi:hypothetical protein
MESWRRVWREMATMISTEALEALKDALVSDDPRLLQGATTTPPPLQCVQDWAVEAGCLLGYCGVIEKGGFGTAIVCDVEEYFALLCFEVDKKMGEPAACRHVLNVYDETPREEMRAMFLPEVQRAIDQRRELATHAVKRAVVG